MKTTRNETHFTFEMTLDRLAAMHTNGLHLYATPTIDGSEIANAYWASSPNFVNDYAILSAVDFVETCGYDESAFDYDQVDECGDEVYTIRYARRIIIAAAENVNKDEYGIRWLNFEGQMFELMGPDEDQSIVDMHNLGYIPTTLTRKDIGQCKNTIYEHEVIFIKP